ncbi:RNA polymerase sigma-70 factor [Zunongwangia sp. H14]|uniref:RNA polymerase sigma-70 factor n=1 Tax=Zunongwangia sp. H14 TaxID=3240792 RepID=UPI0035625FF7
MKTPYSSLDDLQLQCLFDKGNEEAFTVLFERYWERLYCYAFRIYQDEKICEDIVQEVFIKFWKRQDESKILNLEGYLFRSIKYGLANHFRNLKFEKVHEDVLKNMGDQQSPLKQMEYQEFENHALGVIEALPPRCRKIFKLSRFEDLSNIEISQRLNISVRTVETHVSNALKFLRENLTDSRVSIWLLLLFAKC